MGSRFKKELLGVLVHSKMAYDSTVWLVVIQLEELGLGASKTNLIRISLTNTQSIVKFNGQISEALNHITGTTVRLVVVIFQILENFSEVQENRCIPI